MIFFTIIVLLLNNFDIASSWGKTEPPPTTNLTTTPTTTPIPDPLRNIYYDYNLVIEWCMNRSLEVITDHDNWVIETVDFGVTATGFNLTGIYIQFKKGQKTVFFEANIHGGETLATGVAVYVFNELMTNNASSDPEAREVLEGFNWLILPVANPDGYMYKKSDPFMFRKQTWKKSVTNETVEDAANETETETTVEGVTGPPGAIVSRDISKINSENFERIVEHQLKRSKRFFCWGDWFFYPCTTSTRRTTTPTTPIPTTTLPPRPCIGINANLNFKYKFGTMGVIIDDCEQNYPGLEAEKEPVTKHLAQYITDHYNDIIMYISLHTNETRRILMPFSNGEYCHNFNVLKDIAQKTSDFVRKRTRAKYIVGNIADLKERSSGHSVDFARDMGIKYIFMVETQDNKWLNAPPSMIMARGREIMMTNLQLCKGVMREENREPGFYQPITRPPVISHQTKLHPESLVLLPIVLCLIIFQIYHPMLFS